MKYLRLIILVVTIILFGFLFVNNLNEIDIAKIKNEAFTRERISQVWNFKDINELKSFTIQQINYLKINREIASENGIKRNWIVILLFAFTILSYFLPKRIMINTENEKKFEKFEYVYVNIDGSVRELSQNEKEYLIEKFHPNDGARPYIKSSYEQLTPDNKIKGFLKRNKVPKNIEIKNLA